MRRTARVMAVGLAVAAIAAGPLAPRAIDLPGDRVFPESITTTSDGIAYVSSMTGGVMRVDLRSGKVAQWIKPGAYGSSSTFGVLDDPVNGMLWVCNNDLAYMRIRIEGADKGASLKGFDLRTGQGRISLTLPGEKPFCNDIAVAKDGTLYVTETSKSQILRLKKGASAFETWLADPVLGNEHGEGLDGIAFGADGNLYVNNYRSNMLARVAVKPDGTAGKITKIATPRPFEVADGLRPLGGMRFAQAESAGKIAVVTIEGDQARVDTLAEGLSSPTGVDVWGGALWYVQAENKYIFNPKFKGKQPPLPFRVASVALPKTP